MPDDPSLPETLDSVLKKYGKIWIWSILATAVAALSARSYGTASLQFANYNNPGRTQLGASYFFLALMAVAPWVATLVSVWYLFLFLRHHVLPILFPATPPTEPGVYADTGIGEPPDGARLLARAFAAVLASMALEIAMVLLAFIYRALA